MKRANAKENDGIYITGTLGLPAFAVDLGYRSAHICRLMEKLSLNKEYDSIFNHCYEKGMLIDNRCAFASALSEISSCAIDISDGLIGDLSHILKSSKVGAEINLEELPKPPEFEEYNLPDDYQEHLCLYGGGDYELLFTMNESFENRLNTLAHSFNVPVKRIGTIKNGTLELRKHGKMVDYREKPFEHF